MSAGSTGPLEAVGNDVVDLTAPRASGRAEDRRFVDRVFTAAEREAIEASPAPDLELWHAWGAKEAAYKVVSRALDAPPPFVHRAFEVSWDEPLDAPAATNGRRGRVLYTGRIVSTWASVTEEGALHVIALPESGAGADRERVLADVQRLERPGAPWDRPFDELRGLMSDRERDAVHSLPSAAVRVGARNAIAGLLDVDAACLEIVCRPGPMGRRPPLVLLDGRPAPVGLSLSHDGPWIAWALLPFSTHLP